MKTAFLIEPSAHEKHVMIWIVEKEKGIPLLLMKTLLNTGNKPPKNSNKQMKN